MTKLTNQYHHHHRDYITPQHEGAVDPSSLRKLSVVHRLTLSPQQQHLGQRNQQGYASLPITPRDDSEPRIDKAEVEGHLTYQDLHDDLSVLAFDLDRMSEHDPSSGDGDEEPPSPESAPYQGKAQWRPSPVGIRPPNTAAAAGLHNTNPHPMTGRGPGSSRLGTVQSADGRQVPGSTSTSLPTEKVFPIQVGSEIFRLSGASISSDGPSYFTQWFEDQVRQNEETGGVKTLYIDRDPETFRDIARHLQGYYVKPRDGPHFVRLFADAQFYSLPRLISQLFESEIFIQIGEQHFQIPKDIFSDPGNSPNFFSLGFAVFFSTPTEVFPGLDRRGLLRPPPINPPYVPSRSAKNFAELLHLLRGYPLRIRDEEHRAELLRDCRYFHLRGLEQRIIAHDISYNLERQKTEICLRLNDLRPSGISFRADDTDSSNSGAPDTGWVQYARPFVDEQSYELIVEIGGESTILDLDEMRVDFHGKTKAQVSSLFQVVANKMGLPSNQPLGLIMLSGGSSAKRSPSPGHSPLSEDKVRVRFESIADIVLDNQPLGMDWESEKGRHMRAGAVKRMNHPEDDTESLSSPTTTDEPSRSAAQASSSSSSSSSSTAPAPATRRGNTQHGAGAQSAKPGMKNNTMSDKSTATAQSSSIAAPPPPYKKRKVDAIQPKFGRWTIRNGQWRLRVEQSTNSARGKYEIVFIAVKIDAFTNEQARNTRRGFLG